MSQHEHHARADKGLPPQVHRVSAAESTGRGLFGDLSYGQAQVLAVTITAVIMIVAVLACAMIASAV
jgi:hypothetical protein